jgi:hypothetical protein
MFIARLMAALALLVVSAGCESRSPAAPSEPQYGATTCARCQSPIKDPRFAAQYRVGGETVKLFDDPGCLMLALPGEATPPQAIYFHDHDGERWLPAGGTWFASTPRTTSPQGYGWAAYASFDAAQGAVTSSGHGEILGYDQAKDRIGRGGAKLSVIGGRFH